MKSASDAVVQRQMATAPTTLGGYTGVMIAGNGGSPGRDEIHDMTGASTLLRA